MLETKLFPLSSVVLPQGRMRLRIFEPRYVRLVKECMQNNADFGICMYDSSGHQGKGMVSETGTLVTICDFEQLEDGLLGITVEGKSRFQVIQAWAESDGLRVAQVESLTDWDSTPLNSQHQYIAQQLQKVYEEFPQLGNLYDDCLWDDATWVYRRWLEILPIHCEQFDHLAGHTTPELLQHFLSQVIEQ